MPSVSHISKSVNKKILFSTCDTVVYNRKNLSCNARVVDFVDWLATRLIKVSHVVGTQNNESVYH